MSYIRDLNKDPLHHGYKDENSRIEYIFANFVGKLSQSYKKQLIKKFGTPRKHKPSFVDMKEATIDFGEPSWEKQVIVFPPNEKNSKD